MNPFDLIKIGGTFPDLLILFMGLAWSLYSFHWMREKRREIAKLQYQYNTLNTLVFFLCKEHQRNTGVGLIKEGRNSQGDYGVNHQTGIE